MCPVFFRSSRGKKILVRLGLHEFFYKSEFYQKFVKIQVISIFFPLKARNIWYFDHITINVWRSHNYNIIGKMLCYKFMKRFGKIRGKQLFYSRRKKKNQWPNQWNWNKIAKKKICISRRFAKVKRRRWKFYLDEFSSLEGLLQGILSFWLFLQRSLRKRIFARRSQQR